MSDELPIPGPYYIRVRRNRRQIVHEFVDVRVASARTPDQAAQLAETYVEAADGIGEAGWRQDKAPTRDETYYHGALNADVISEKDFNERKEDA